MLSIVIIILLIQHILPTYQFQTIQSALSSTVELPCSITSQNIEPTNLAKVNVKRTVSRGEHNNNDIMSLKPTDEYIDTQHVIFILFRLSGFVMIKQILLVLIQL